MITLRSAWPARLLLLLNAALYLLYFLRLDADFPNGSPWNDWSKFTDEGWYGGAAIHRALTGSGYIPGGFNPAVALPIWPALLGLWFRVAGAGIVQARALAVLLLGLSCLLLHRLLRRWAGATIAALASLLILANPYVFAFGRLAILEPLVAALFLLALGFAELAGQTTHRFLRVAASLATGALLTAGVFTKTTAAVLAPAVLYHLAATTLRQNGRGSAAKRRTDAAGLAAITAATAAFTWSLWFLLAVRPHRLADYRQLFAINSGHAHGRILPQVMATALGDSLWTGRIAVPLAIVFIALSTRWLRELWRIPLFGSSVFALAATVGYIGWHTWRQPRYYFVCVAPVAAIIALGLRALQQHAAVSKTRSRGLSLSAAVFVVSLSIVLMLRETLGSLSQPAHSMRDAAHSIAAAIRRDPAHRQLLLASSGDTMTLFTGLPAANPDWPIAGLPRFLDEQQPGWYAAYTPWEDETLRTVQTRYRTTEVARYRVFDDPDHRALILYRLDPRP